MIYNQIFKIWRKRRFDLFLGKLSPALSDTMLDVGGYPWCWATRNPFVARIDALNIHEVAYPEQGGSKQKVQFLIGDGCSLPFPNRCYDIGYSNSVIEHVGSWERQQQFAFEIRRVSNGLWVQTPAYECPIEPHYMAPFIHYLPVGLQKRLVRWDYPMGIDFRSGACGSGCDGGHDRLLRRSEMQQLFPDCEIITERMLGLIPKSYIAIRRKRLRLSGNCSASDPGRVGASIVPEDQLLRTQRNTLSGYLRVSIPQIPFLRNIQLLCSNA